MKGLTQGSVVLELHAQEAAAPDWIHIVPSGTFSGKDGRGPFHLNSPQEVITASFPNPKRPIPVDYNHTLYAQKHDAGAAGWIDRMESRNDGIWAHVEWTPKASRLIAEKEWRFLSPAFETAEDGTVKRIDSVGLVNRPNLPLPALNSESSQDKLSDGQLREKICSLLGLDSSAVSSDILQAMEDVLADRSSKKPPKMEKNSRLSRNDLSLLHGIRKDVDVIRETISTHSHQENKILDTARTDLDLEIKKQLGLA